MLKFILKKIRMLKQRRTAGLPVEKNLFVVMFKSQYNQNVIINSTF